MSHNYFNVFVVFSTFQLLYFLTVGIFVIGLIVFHFSSKRLKSSKTHYFGVFKIALATFFAIRFEVLKL